MPALDDIINGKLDILGEGAIDTPTNKEYSEGDLSAILAKDESERSEEEIEALEKNQDIVVKLSNKEEEEDSKEEEEIEKQISSILEKSEEERTDEEKKLLKDNQEIVDKLTINAIDEIRDKEGFVEGKKYEASTEGMIQYMKDRDAVRDRELASAILNTYPQVAALYEHLSKGYLVNTFMKSVNKPDILSVGLKPLDEKMTEEQKNNMTENYKKVISHHLQKTGVPTKIIDATIKAAQVEGSLSELAQESFAKLDEEFKKELANENQKAIDLAKAEQQARVDELNKIKNIISKNDFGEGKYIPEADLPMFKKYVLEPVNKQGQTAADIAFDKMTMEDSLYLDYLLMKKFKGIRQTTVKSTQFIKSTKDLNQNTRLNSKGGKTRVTPNEELPSFDIKSILQS